MSKFKFYKTQEEKKQTLSESLKRNLARRKQQKVSEGDDLHSKEGGEVSQNENSDFVFIKRKKKKDKDKK